MTRTTAQLALTPGTFDLAQKLAERGRVFVGPNAIKVSNEAGFLAANRFAKKDGPHLVLLDEPGLEEVLRQNSESAQKAD